MKTILAWVLVTTYNSAGIQYSPPVATLADCERLGSAVAYSLSKKCVQVNLVVNK